MADARSMGHPTHEVGAVPRGIAVRFIVLVGLLGGLLLWLLDGTGPVPAANNAIQHLTLYQARFAAWLLGLAGQEVGAVGATLQGPGFSCTVDTGCNGMNAVALMTAGLLSFPAPLRLRLPGLLLVPVVFLINVIRIAGLYWTGANAPSLFGTAHVYVGQVVVILLTASLWFGWLTWASTRARS